MGKNDLLGSIKLSDSEKQAIALLVESDGFKVWSKKVVKAREVQIAGTALSAIDENGLWYAKGMSFENSKQISILQQIADEFEKSS